MNKEQLQFFYDEIMGMFGWDDGDEASGVDPLLWAKKEIFLLRDNLRNYKAQVYMTDADNIKLRAELAAANKAVEEFGDHKSVCCTRFGGNDKPCNCGFDAWWLTAHPGKEQE